MRLKTLLSPQTLVNGAAAKHVLGADPRPHDRIHESRPIAESYVTPKMNGVSQGVDNTSADIVSGENRTTHTKNREIISAMSADAHNANLKLPESQVRAKSRRQPSFFL